MPDPHAIGSIPPQLETERVDDLEVVFAGEIYTGWKSVTVTRALDSGSGRFQVTTALPPGTSWRILDQSKVVLRLGETPVLTGFVDAVEASITNEEGTTVSVTGRDAVGDLIDASATASPPQFVNVTLVDLIKQLIQPFDVGVVLGDSQGAPFPKFALSTGESPWAAIQRACRLRALLCYSDGAGSLILRREYSSNAERALVMGENLLSFRAKRDSSGRFRTYIVRSQTSGSDLSFGESVAAIEGKAFDLDVDRDRTLILSGDAATFESARDFAQWEAASRRARANVAECVVQGWRQGPGLAPWQPNTLVDVLVPTLGVDAQLVIARVQHEKGGAGSPRLTRLQLVPRDAYIPEPQIPQNDAPFGSGFLGGS